MGEISDVQYFRENFYQSLNVPVSRLKPDTGFSLGRTTEITRDEIKFGKFVFKMRNRFGQLFDDLLRVQLLLKGIISREDWSDIKQGIFYDFLKDNDFAEMKNLEIWKERIAMVRETEDFVGKYVSPDFVRRKILRFTDEDIDQMQQEMDQSQANNPQNMGEPGMEGPMPPGQEGQEGPAPKEGEMEEI